MGKQENLELYIHIPFCKKKCAYCDFLSAPATEMMQEQYVHCLLAEIKEKAPFYANYQISTIFIGGGTPSILRAGFILDIMEAVHRAFHVKKDAEVTLECNPKTISFEKLLFYQKAGINRISIGLQSTENAELKELGRIHTYEDFLESYDLIRKSGFSNVNIDLMSALPYQTLKSYEKTLQRVLQLRPEHISAYSLIIEEGTPFYEKYESDEILREQGKIPEALPSEETERTMYEMTKELLKQHGYFRYEISNYAKKGYECEHNIGYWTRENYLGLGLGSASLVEEKRFSNTRELKKYLSGDFTIENQEILNKNARIEEFMFLGLRLTKGVSQAQFLNQFGLSIENVYGKVLTKLQREGLLAKKDGRIFLTEQGLDVSNYVMAQFLLD
ncbi:oxygen-independent coproporphyrinogen III oxidase [Roseburia hominis]|uniref:radical SAM family heme chaperone HemW n=1 Tax=Roseburia hominis TaxID=301301 RepID=UPI001F3057E6|nr:oxygen-independent coproporphyrinogen III oxidase [Roseburia hominis]